MGPPATERLARDATQGYMVYLWMTDTDGLGLRPGSAKLAVYATIYHYTHHDTSLLIATQSHIARLTGYARQSVNAALQELLEDGLVYVRARASTRHGGRHVNIYSASQVAVNEALARWTGAVAETVLDGDFVIGPFREATGQLADRPVDGPRSGPHENAAGKAQAGPNVMLRDIGGGEAWETPGTPGVSKTHPNVAPDDIPNVAPHDSVAQRDIGGGPPASGDAFFQQPHIKNDTRLSPIPCPLSPVGGGGGEGAAYDDDPVLKAARALCEISVKPVKEEWVPEVIDALRELDRRGVSPAEAVEAYRESLRDFWATHDGPEGAMSLTHWLAPAPTTNRLNRWLARRAASKAPAEKAGGPWRPVVARTSDGWVCLNAPGGASALRLPSSATRDEAVHAATRAFAVGPASGRG